MLDEVALPPQIELRWGHKVTRVVRNDAEHGGPVKDPRFAPLVPEDADLGTLKSIPLHKVRLPRHACERLGLRNKSAALLVRPDQHVCSRWTTVTPQRLQAALAQATAQATEINPC